MHLTCLSLARARGYDIPISTLQQVPGTIITVVVCWGSFMAWIAGARLCERRSSARPRPTMRTSCACILLCAGLSVASAAYTVGLHELRAKVSGTDPHSEDAASNSYYTVKVKIGTQVFRVRLDTCAPTQLPTLVWFDHDDLRCERSHRPCVSPLYRSATGRATFATDNSGGL